MLELLVVLMILGLLAAVATPQVLKYLGSAKTDTAKLQIKNLAAIIDFYRLDVGDYPSGELGLEALLKRPPNVEGWNGPYVKKAESLTDPWGVRYVYRYPGQHGEYDLYTLGADKAEGGTGEGRDVTNW